MKINNEQCKTCKYGTNLSGAGFCNYLEKTGHMRGCETYPKCKKYECKEEEVKNTNVKLLYQTLLFGTKSTLKQKNRY